MADVYPEAADFAVRVLYQHPHREICREKREATETVAPPCKGSGLVSARGFYGIGIVGSKTPINVGTLWRSAGILGASYMFTAGRRYPQQASDTIKAWKHTPFFEFDDDEALFSAIPRGCWPVAVEMGGRSKPLATLVHPERACYILGAEDTGVPPRVLERCPLVVSIPGDHSLNVAVAGSIVLYDRLAKTALNTDDCQQSSPSSCPETNQKAGFGGGVSRPCERQRQAAAVTALSVSPTGRAEQSDA